MAISFSCKFWIFRLLKAENTWFLNVSELQCSSVWKAKMMLLKLQNRKIVPKFIWNCFITWLFAPLQSNCLSWLLFFVWDRPLEKWWGDVGRKQKNIHAREVDWKKNRAKTKWRKNNFCRVNCNVGLINCTCLNDTLAATSCCSFNFFVLVSLRKGKRTFSPFNSDTFCL